MHLALLDRATGTSYDVWTKEGIIGRDGSCAVVLTGDAAKLVSSRHARVFVADGKWWIEDSGSRNGTFVHGSKIEVGVRHALHKGVVIGLGATGTRLEVIGAEVMADAAKTMLDGFTPPAPAPRPVSAPNPAPRPAMNAGATMLDPGAAWEPAPKRGPAAGDGHQVHLVLRGSGGDMHTIDAAIARIGRSMDCDIHIDGDKAGSVSRVHTEILIVGGRVVVRDGGSRHGTLHNGKRVSTPEPLARGDTIALGPAGPSFSVIELSGGSVPAAAPAHAAPAAHHDATFAPAETGGVRSMMLRPVLGHRSHKHAKLIRGVAYGVLVVGVAGFGLLVMANLRAQRAAADAAANQGPNWPLVARTNQGSVGVVTLYIGRTTRAGTGFAISPSGYFVTTRQMVRGDSGGLADSVLVTMADGSAKLRADVLVGDTAADVGVLKIRNYHGPVVATIDWSGTDALQGEPAAVIGFPHGADLAADASGVARTSITTGTFSQVLPSAIQLAGFSGAGSRGSPVLNRTGEIVGIYRGAFNDLSGLGLAVPMSRVSALLPPSARAELKIP